MIQCHALYGGEVLRLVLDRPKANLLDVAMIAALGAAIEAEVGPATKLLVFEGAGDHFSFGASVQEHQAEHAGGMLAAFHAFFHLLADAAVPTCAVVRGQCLGGGLELASWCTWIVATPDARLGQPEIRLAVFPPMASILLPWRAGGALALDLCVSGKTITALEAERRGLVDAVVEDPQACVDRLYQEHLVGASALALRFAERAARISLRARIEADLPRLERLYLDELMKTHDANEGLAAFLERRRPAFTHA